MLIGSTFAQQKIIKEGNVDCQFLIAQAATILHYNLTPKSEREKQELKPTLAITKHAEIDTNLNTKDSSTILELRDRLTRGSKTQMKLKTFTIWFPTLLWYLSCLRPDNNRELAPAGVEKYINVCLRLCKKQKLD